MRARVGLVAIWLPMSTLTAQSVGIAAVDSANAARAAWSRAARADDLAVSRREIDRAAAAWPTQAT